MNRLLLNCDQVFDVLTRGPFPTGAPDDEAVERHLAACHECRQLAEALQPAVALLHEAVSAGESLDLPEYRGALAASRPGRRRPIFPRLQAECDVDATWRLAPRPRSQVNGQTATTIGNVRLIALSLLVAVAVMGAGRVIFSPLGKSSATSLAASLFRAPAETPVANGVPGELSLLTLASLNLPANCLPLTHRATTPKEAARIAEALANGSLDALHCCTECHHAGRSSGRSAPRLGALADATCRACHRG